MSHINYKKIRTIIGLQLFLFSFIAGPIYAQGIPKNYHKNIVVLGAKSIQFDFYASVNKNCTLAPLPTIRILEKPKLGTFTVIRARVNTKRFEGCPEMAVNALVVSYQARHGNAATDKFIYEVSYFDGTIAQYHVDVIIRERSVPNNPSSNEIKI